MDGIQQSGRVVPVAAPGIDVFVGAARSFVASRLPFWIALSLLSLSVGVVYIDTLSEPARLAWNEWAFYEWLINYRGGFVRRGLAGELIARFQSGREIEFLNGWVFVQACVFFGLFVAFVLRMTTNPRAVALLLLSPAGIVWMAVSNEHFYRKEIMSYAVVLACGLLYSSWARRPRVSTKTVLTGLTFLAATVLPFVHEPFVFFALVPLAMIASHVDRRSDGRRWRLAGLVAISAALFFAMSAFKGDARTSAAIWDSVSGETKIALHARGVSGGISAIGWSLGQALELSVLTLMSGLSTYFLLVLAIVYATLGYAVAPLRRMSFGEVLASERFIAQFSLALIAVAPLFVLGWDWGRWIVGINVSALVVTALDLEPPAWCGACVRRVMRIRRAAVVFPALLLLSIATRAPECCVSATGTDYATNPALRAVTTAWRIRIPDDIVGTVPEGYVRPPPTFPE